MVIDETWVNGESRGHRLSASFSPLLCTKGLHLSGKRCDFFILKSHGIQDGTTFAISGHVPRVAALVAPGSLITCLCPSLQKCIRFNPDATVWVAKQRILCSLNQSLKDVLNYGLFQPASNGRDGKFLDEERLLREYPQPVGKGVPSLEVLGTAGGGPAPKPKCDLFQKSTPPG